MGNARSLARYEQTLSDFNDQVEMINSSLHMFKGQRRDAGLTTIQSQLRWDNQFEVHWWDRDRREQADLAKSQYEALRAETEDDEPDSPGAEDWLGLKVANISVDYFPRVPQEPLNICRAPSEVTHRGRGLVRRVEVQQG